MVLGKLPVPGRSTIWITVGQGPTALAVGAGGGCFDIFSLAYQSSLLSPSLWETARYTLKYFLKGPLSPKQPTNNQHVHVELIYRKFIVTDQSYNMSCHDKNFVPCPTRFSCPACDPWIGSLAYYPLHHRRS